MRKMSPFRLVCYSTLNILIRIQYMIVIRGSIVKLQMRHIKSLAKQAALGGKVVSMQYNLVWNKRKKIHLSDTIYKKKTVGA